MVRIDIPIQDEKIDSALLLAKDFLRNIEAGTPPEKADYVFGA